VTLPLAGTYAEFYDIYREVLTKSDQHDVLERLEAQILKNPDAEEAASWMEGAGLEDVDVEVEDFSLLFKSSREFFFAPVIEYGPLAAWKEIAGKGQTMQEIFWQIKESIDAYFRERAFEITVKAGCLRGIKPERKVSFRSEEVTKPRSGEVAIADLTPPPEEPPSTPDEEIKDNFVLDDEDEEVTH
jgi:hypothetical protein